ncbi:cerebellin 18 [Lampris incognitus]|uniref:cerebellin 18 n=1 Tax=Lampris incognitus TaxID=2546036 RepID=UPI0024B4D1DA|nr:cerebellin 18 [Lampris incognitus]
MSSTFDIMREAALSLDSPLPCHNYNCDCAYKHQRGCCCVANQVNALEEATFVRMVGLWEQLSRLQDDVAELTDNTQIAFTAVMAPMLQDNCFGPFTTNVTIPYTSIILNQGYGYNPTLGIFTAPRSGIYVFSFTAYSNVGDPEGRLYHKVQLMKNGQVVASMWEDNREDMEDSGTQVVLVALRRGGQAYMQLLSGRNLCGDTRGDNIFSGHFLYPYEEE